MWIRTPFPSLLLLIFLIALPACAGPKRVGELLELKRDEDAIQAQLEEERKSFEAVKEAIEKGRLARGMDRDEIIERFGAPAYQMEERPLTKCVYRPPGAKRFGGEKIYLYFDRGERLASWKYRPASAGSD